MNVRTGKSSLRAEKMD